MKYFLFSIMILPFSVQATCMMEVTKCEAKNSFQNIYQLEKVSCSAPGGPLRTSKTFKIFNKLSSDCGPVYSEGCMKPLVNRNLNQTRHNYFQVEIKKVGKKSFIKIDDRRVLHQGDFHLSTPDSDFMFLEGYNCFTKW